MIKTIPINQQIIEIEKIISIDTNYQSTIHIDDKYTSITFEQPEDITGTANETFIILNIGENGYIISEDILSNSTSAPMNTINYRGWRK
jgi:hypothetical protein